MQLAIEFHAIVEIDEESSDTSAQTHNIHGEVTADEVKENDIVRISVKDSGEGIKEEDLPLIWDRYYKVDKIHKRAVIGTGLGLSIVKNVLLLHGSRFGVSSELHKGSTFWFEFKIVD